MSRELLQRAHDALMEVDRGCDRHLIDALNAELAKPEPQPVARVSEGLRLEWVCTQAAAKVLIGQKLYPRDGV